MMDNAGRRRRLEFVSLDLKLTLLIEVESRAINMRINLLSLTQRYCSPLSAKCISAPRQRFEPRTNRLWDGLRGINKGDEVKLTSITKSAFPFAPVKKKLDGSRSYQLLF